MHTEAEAFLQRILADPDDDAPRLVYADWLDDRGDPRGEFIRVQVALAHLPDDSPRRPPLAAAERELLDAFRDEWAAPFRGLASGLEFRRGFVDEVKVAARPFLANAADLFAAGPVRHVHLLDVGGHLPAIVRTPLLARLSALTVYAQHAGEPLARLVAGCPHLAGLRALHVGRNRLGDEGVMALAASPHLANLEDLDLSENEIGEAGARALAGSPNLSALKRLELAGNHVGPAGAEALATSDRLPRLCGLGLSANGLGLPSIHVLAGVSAVTRVATLDLSANGLGPAGLRAVLRRPSAVERLDLGRNDLGDDGVRELTACGHVGDLRALRLAGNGIGDDGGRLLAACPHLHRLVYLDLSNNPIGDVGFRAFLESKTLPNLRRLVTPGVGVSPPMRGRLDMKYRGVRPRY